MKDQPQTSGDVDTSITVLGLGFRFQGSEFGFLGFRLRFRAQNMARTG